MTALSTLRSSRIAIDTGVDRRGLPAGAIVVRVVEPAGLAHRDEGASVPTATSPSPGRHIPAHAGTDDGANLAATEDPR